jgi:hypothetical protein
MSPGRQKKDGFLPDVILSVAAIIKANSGLMLVSVSSAMPFGFDIFFWFFVEGLLAACRAEVVGLALVIGFASGSLRVDVHATNGIFYHVRYLLLMSSLLIVE